jgi:hypothetical protein
MSVGTPEICPATSVALVPRLAGLHAPTLQILREVIPGGCSGEVYPWVVSDISLGGWRSHQVAAEFCAQLALAPPRPPLAASLGPPLARHGELSYADLISQGIDAEALGDAATLTAMDAATRIVAAVQAGPPQIFLVFAPRYSINWEPEDLLFVQLLAPRLESTGSQLILAYVDPPAVPIDLSIEWLNQPQPAPPPGAGGLLGLVPGTVDPQMAAAVKAAERIGAALVVMLPLAHGHMLIAPECRRLPSAVPRLEYDRLATAAGECDWLRAYAQYYGNNAFVEPQFLLRQAWQRFSEGGSAVALRLLDRATACSVTPLERAIAVCQAQGMRIALQHFGDAAQAPDPSEAVPATLRSFLLQAKGYGFVMSGDPESAMAYLRRARALFEPDLVSREYLYLLNISALASLKLGDPHAALAIERDIEARVATLPTPDWHLKYITCINIARLSRRLGDLEATRCSYDLAFATTMGVRSESEAVYTNVCAARLETERGYCLEAFLAWLRASLHWVAARTPEALGARVANSLVGPLPASPERLVEEVSQVLLSSLAGAARESGQASVVTTATADLDMAAPVFVRADCLTAEARPDWALGGPGWSVLGSSRRLACTVARVDTQSRRRLRALVCRLLARLSSAGELDDAETIVVDDRLGQELATTASELLESAVRLEVSRLSFGDTYLTLGESAQARLEAQARVQLGSAVARVDLGASCATVTFKRSLPTATVSSEVGLLLTELSNNPSLTELSARVPSTRNLGELWRQLRALEASRMVYLSFPEASCIAAGISWRSRVN